MTGAEPASLWEVESMETPLLARRRLFSLTRFPLGSGINGNMLISHGYVEGQVFHPLPSGKWNQWKPSSFISFCKYLETRFPLGSGINGNVGVVLNRCSLPCDPLPSGKWNQ